MISRFLIEVPCHSLFMAFSPETLSNLGQQLTLRQAQSDHENAVITIRPHRSGWIVTLEGEYA